MKREMIAIGLMCLTGCASMKANMMINALNAHPDTLLCMEANGINTGEFENCARREITAGEKPRDCLADAAKRQIARECILLGMEEDKEAAGSPAAVQAAAQQQEKSFEMLRMGTQLMQPAPVWHRYQLNY